MDWKAEQEWALVASEGGPQAEGGGTGGMMLVEEEKAKTPITFAVPGGTGEGADLESPISEWHRVQLWEWGAWRGSGEVFEEVVEYRCHRKGE